MRVPPPPQRCILRKEDMKRRTGHFGDATYARWEAEDRFPKRLHITGNVVGWYEDEIDEWVASRRRSVEVADRDTIPPPAPRKAVGVSG